MCAWIFFIDLWTMVTPEEYEVQFTGSRSKDCGLWSYQGVCVFCFAQTTGQRISQYLETDWPSWARYVMSTLKSSLQIWNNVIAI